MSETPSVPSASVAPSAPSTSAAAAIPNNYGVATSMADVQNQINEMEAFFETGATLPVDEEGKCASGVGTCRGRAH